MLQMKNKIANKKFIFWASVIVWICIALGLLIYLDGIQGPKCDEQDQISSTHSANPKIFDNDNNYYVWERKEAIKFQFDEFLKSINYLFIAAGAILVFVGKSVIDPIIKREKIDYLNSSTVFFFLTNAALASAFSIISGFFARGYFNSIGTQKCFSIYAEVGISSLTQLLAFSLAVILLIIAISQIVITQKESNLKKKETENKKEKI